MINFINRTYYLNALANLKKETIVTRTSQIKILTIKGGQKSHRWRSRNITLFCPELVLSVTIYPPCAVGLSQDQSCLTDGGIMGMDLRGQHLVFLDVSSLSVN